MTINGKTTNADIFTNNIEEAALQWVTELCDHPAFEGVPIVQMRVLGNKITDTRWEK